MEHRRENTEHDFPKTGKNFGSLWRMLWEEAEDKWGQNSPAQLHTTECKSTVTEMFPLRGCVKRAADNSTVGKKLQSTSALHSQDIRGRTNTPAGRFASEGRESNPWKDGRFVPL